METVGSEREPNSLRVLMGDDAGFGSKEMGAVRKNAVLDAISATWSVEDPSPAFV
jgi:hypothetical protein